MSDLITNSHSAMYPVLCCPLSSKHRIAIFNPTGRREYLIPISARESPMDLQIYQRLCQRHMKLNSRGGGDLCRVE